MNISQTMRFDDGQLLVFDLTQVRIDYDGSVVAGMKELRIVAVGLHGADDAIELPRSRRRTWEEEMPGYIDFERGIDVLRDDVLISRKVHQLVIVAQDRRGRCLENRDLRSCHVTSSVSAARLRGSTPRSRLQPERSIDDGDDCETPEGDTENERAIRQQHFRWIACSPLMHEVEVSEDAVDWKRCRQHELMRAELLYRLEARTVDDVGHQRRRRDHANHLIEQIRVVLLQDPAMLRCRARKHHQFMAPL